MNEVYLLTGGNMGDRMDNLGRARIAIGRECGRIIKTSSVYETAAWGEEDQPAFLNQVLVVQTRLEAEDLLQTILSIERSQGRRREKKYGPRLIDIDILFYDDEVICKPGLVVPHPRMQFRRFVLEPLAELSPGKIHPVLHQTISTLLAECTDPLSVNKIT